MTARLNADDATQAYLKQVATASKSVVSKLKPPTPSITARAGGGAHSRDLSEAERLIPTLGHNPVSDAVGGATLGIGPHRGGESALLKYWRPIMLKPGGWRRCVITLGKHPDLAPNVKGLCAWIHHETTGRWPNEGHHNNRGRTSVRRVLEGDAAPHAQGAASVVGDVEREIPKSLNGNRIAGELSGEFWRVAVATKSLFATHVPLGQAAIDFKASAYRRIHQGTTAQNVVQETGHHPLVGGELGASVGTEHAIGATFSHTENALGRQLSPQGLHARERCPAGFEFGGRFTSHLNPECGDKFFSLPSPHGSAIHDAVGAAEHHAAGTEQSAAVPVHVPDSAAPNGHAQADAVAKAITRVAHSKGAGSLMVRSDGVTLKPDVSLARLAGAKASQDMTRAALVAKVSSPGAIGNAEIPVLAGGRINAVHFVLPDGSHMDLTTATGAPLSTAEGNVLTRKWAAISKGGAVGQPLKDLVTQFPTLRLEADDAHLKGKPIPARAKSANFLNPATFVTTVLPWRSDEAPELV